MMIFVDCQPYPQGCSQKEGKHQEDRGKQKQERRQNNETTIHEETKRSGRYKKSFKMPDRQPHRNYEQQTRQRRESSTPRQGHK